MKLLRFILFLILSNFVLICYAQKEGNVWTFPDSIAIDFNDSLSPVITNSQVTITGFGFPAYNQTSISDSSGSLFCYASATQYSFSGLQVFDKYHSMMPNGHNLMGHPNYISLLLPYPGKDSIICLLYIARDSVNTNLYHLLYSLINKNLRNGLGDVILRDSIIYTNDLSNFKLTSCKHANGRDWWIFIYDRSIQSYVSFLLSVDGLIHMNDQSVGPSPNCQVFGRLTFSNDGNKMLAVGWAGCINVFDFDRCTGVLSNLRDIGEHLSTMEYQYFYAIFSGNGNLFYVTPDNIVKVCYQWNLDAGSLTDIINSKTLINEYPDTGVVLNNTYFGHKLGPDGKMYVPICNNYFGGSNGNTFVTQHLDVIEFPDTPGLGCNYIRQGFDLGGRRVTGDLPNIPYFGLGAIPGSICDSLNIGINENNLSSAGIEVFPNPSSGIFSFKLKDQNDKIISASLQNTMGKEVMAVKNYASSLDASRLPPGVYIAKIQTRKKKFLVAKLIKQ